MKEFAYIHEEGTLPEPLDRIPFFESFQGRHLNDILYSSYFIQADPGDEVIKEDQEDSRIFVLLTGSLEVMKNGEVLATLATAGEIFGELAAVTNEKRTASVVASNSSARSSPRKITPATMPPSTASSPASSPTVSKRPRSSSASLRKSLRK